MKEKMIGSGSFTGRLEKKEKKRLSCGDCAFCKNGNYPLVAMDGANYSVESRLYHTRLV